MRMSRRLTDVLGDDAELDEFGYKQELDRSLGSFATFAAGISYISILTGTFQLFYFGFAFGGPAYWWSWPWCRRPADGRAVLLRARVALPDRGSIYNWSKRLGSPHVAWLAGWMMLTASIVTVAAVALAYQITLPEIDDFFQFYGDGTGQVRLRRQRSDPRHRADHLHDGGQRDRRQADVADQQHRHGHRAGRRLPARRRVPGQRHPRPGRRLRDPGPRRGLGPRIPRRVPRRLAGLRVRHVRVRHGELARRGVASTRARTRRARSCGRSSPRSSSAARSCCSR